MTEKSCLNCGYIEYIKGKFVNCSSDSRCINYSNWALSLKDAKKAYEDYQNTPPSNVSHSAVKNYIKALGREIERLKNE